LDGVHSRPIFATRQAVLQASASDLRGLDSVPVLIIFGESDIYGPTTRLLAVRYPAARFVVIPQAGHVPWLQNRAVFSEVLVKFFESA
jgi:pimeloyl-ACP methyl ester carboxylesterase